MGKQGHINSIAPLLIFLAMTEAQPPTQRSPREERNLFKHYFMCDYPFHL